MNGKEVEGGSKRPVKYQIYLDNSLQERFSKYLRDNFTKGARAFTATFRKALDEFLEKRGY